MSEEHYFLSGDCMKEIVDYCRSKFPEEACGLLIKKEEGIAFAPCPNTSSQDRTQFFAISPTDYVKASKEGKVVGVVHSHTDDMSDFTQNDRDFQKVEGLPWLLIWLGGGGDPQIKWLRDQKYVAPLYGRKYKWHIHDCLSFIRDFFEQEYSIHIPDFYREYGFWEKQKEPYLENFEKAGFVEVPMKDMQPGDVILMRYGGYTTSHGAVYLGNNELAHHLNGMLSCKDIYSKWYQERTTKVVRHKDMIK